MTGETLTLSRLAFRARKEWPTEDAEVVARRIAESLTKPQLVELVAAALVDEIEEVRWHENRKSVLREMSSDPDVQAERQLRRQTAKRIKADVEERRRVLASDPDEYDRRFGLGQIIAQFKDEVRLELTAELLGMTFMQGGQSVTFGAATLAEHEQRMYSLRRHVDGTITTFRLHHAAAKLLRESGASCLDMIQVAA